MGTDEDHPTGEYHMHCHVLTHMGEGMMGSLVVANGGQSTRLPHGVPCQMPMPQPVEDTKVSIHDATFDPQNITIKMGQSVLWTNNDSEDHTVTADDKSFDSQSLAPGKTFSHMFMNQGTFTYHCSIHTKMKGQVTVS
jgi:plastocyanin